MDIEDAHKLKILTFEETKTLLLGFFEESIQKDILRRIADEDLTDENEQVVYMRACAIGKLENVCAEAFLKHEQEILDGTFEGELIDFESTLRVGTPGGEIESTGREKQNRIRYNRDGFTQTTITPMHGGVTFTNDEWSRLILWVDANGACWGNFEGIRK